MQWYLCTGQLPFTGGVGAESRGGAESWVDWHLSPNFYVGVEICEKAILQRNPGQTWAQFHAYSSWMACWTEGAERPPPVTRLVELSARMRKIFDQLWQKISRVPNRRREGQRWSEICHCSHWGGLTHEAWKRCSYSMRNQISTQFAQSLLVGTSITRFWFHSNSNIFIK